MTLKRKITNYKFRQEVKKKYGLSLFRVWCLRHRGKRDCKKNIIRKYKTGEYFSPYFNQEIQLCLAQIHNELEILSKIELRINSRAERIEYMCSVKKNQTKKVQEYFDNNEKDGMLQFDKEDNSYSLSEKAATYMAKNKQIDSLMCTIELLNSQKRECIFIIQKETNITYLRCKYFYDVLISRLSAYWSGALSVDKKSEDFPPLFDINKVVLNIERKIDMIKEMGKTYE